MLNRTEMDNFANIFVDFQKRGKSKDKDGKSSFNTVYTLRIQPISEIAKLDEKLAPWESHDAPGKKRADSDQDSFSVK